MNILYTILAILVTAQVSGGKVLAIDEIMQDGRQIQAAAKTLNLKVLRVYGGSSDYGESSHMVQRAYKIGDVDGTNESALLNQIKEYFEKDITERGWVVENRAIPEREEDDDFLRFSIDYKFQELAGTVIIKSVRLDGAWLIFIDLLEQKK